MGVLHEIRAANLLPIRDSKEPILTTVESGVVTLVQAAKPVFRLKVPPTTKRLDHVFADPDGRRLAVAHEIDTDRQPQELLIFKAGAPPNADPTSIESTETKIDEVDLRRSIEEKSPNQPRLLAIQFSARY